MREVDDICSVLDSYVNPIAMTARDLARVEDARSPKSGLRKTLLRAKLDHYVALCGFLFHEWQVQGHDEVRWRSYNERFVNLFEKVYPVALETMAMRCDNELLTSAPGFSYPGMHQFRYAA